MTKKYAVQHPKGKIVVVENLNKFSIKHKLNPVCMYKASVRDDVVSHKGFKVKRIDNDNEHVDFHEYKRTKKRSKSANEAVANSTSKYWLIISPEGDIQTVFNLCKFSRENRMSHLELYRVANGERKDYNGYKVKRLDTFDYNDMGELV